MLGTAQSGLPSLGPGDLVRDAELMTEARAMAKRVLSEDPGLERPEHARLRRYVDAQAGRGVLSEG
jgi:ATP-dependent DNA helicase RecG